MTTDRGPAPLTPECPACHHRDHDPGSCHWCPYCELHIDDALAWVRRIDPDLFAEAVDAERERSGRLEAAARRVLRPVEESDGCCCYVCNCAAHAALRDALGEADREG
jgi:hypothetical protein